MGGRTRHEKYVLGSFHSRDLLIWLKVLALEPSNTDSSHHRLRNQMLKVRKLLNYDAKSSQKKRKFDQYMDYGKSAGSFERIREKYGSQLVENQRRGESSSLSCSPLSKEKCGSLQGTQGHVAFRTINDRLEYCSICTQDYSHLSGYNESIKGSNLLKQGNLKSHCEIFENSSSYTPSNETSIKEEQNIELYKELKSYVNEDFDDSSTNSCSLSSTGNEEGKLGGNSCSLSSAGNEDRKLIRPLKKFLPFRGNHLSRSVIPIGPRFEAEIPQWEGKSNIRHHNIDDDLKWFGTEIWPMPNIKETSTKGVGKGRPDACSCDFPRSIDCVQQHIGEARELLQSEIGTAFSSWKFDEMGEDVSKSWTMEEQKEFESLVRLNPLSNDMVDFWKLAMDYFPSKSLKSMVNYYCNVYIPRRMSKETRASFGMVDCGNDKIMECKNGDDYSTIGMRIIPTCKLRKSRIII